MRMRPSLSLSGTPEHSFFTPSASYQREVFTPSASYQREVFTPSAWMSCLADFDDFGEIFYLFGRK